jgi:hypothetical protein
MIQNLFRHLGGIESYGIISMCLFGGTFIGVLVWTIARKESYLDYMSRVALDQEDCGPPGSSGTHFPAPQPCPGTSARPGTNGLLSPANSSREGEGETSSVDRRNLTSEELEKGIYE